ncbi:MAG: RidA family protein [Pirellulaceae bacterium]|jgi:enamine deaminase RidA (YjgF/YER057c/UK114 family)|nr:RidA family protein [Pirellulaceae bacterium]
MNENQSRRTFIRETFLVGAGVTAGVCLPSLFRGSSPQTAVAAEKDKAGSAEQRLKELGIELPPPPKPVAVYIPAVHVGDMVYSSGHGPGRVDGEPVRGRVGDDLTLKQGYDAARLTGLNVLSSVRSVLGDLDKVVRLVKVLGMVNSTADFTDHPKVVNGFSELMVQVFGEKNGKGARSAVGMGSLPGNIPCEIEAIFEVRG